MVGHGKTPAKTSLKAHIAFLERALRMADTDLGDMLRRRPARRERDDLLQNVVGVDVAKSITAPSHRDVTVGISPIQR
jgi:hypothetical protein